ncbi:uncharacterized protein LOC117823392 [Xyrichtys novacula]|uniref:Uncharacterized protein LOC117823392 n=1 Tax=Xyrichtys novacula TaxID=13765 RepID=A0AAV1FPJ7_XYRNO|nr:uncharacterized protein LOC117823392 [Xyrichtys novacula]
MSTVGEQIKDIILKVLPSLSEDTQQRVISELQTMGVETVEDLKYVKQDDMRDLLPITQQRKLLEAFKTEASPVPLNLQFLPVNPAHIKLPTITSPLPCFSPTNFSLQPSFSQEATPCSATPCSATPCSATPCSATPCSATPCSATPCSSRVGKRTSNIPDKWPENFEVPWHKMPDGVKLAMANMRRPSPEKRRQMIRILVDELRKCDINPTRHECLIVCRNIVRQYPSSFADMTPGGAIVGEGFSTLLSQVKRRIENLNRAGIIKRHRSSGLCKPADSYGCVHFQPAMPLDETEETLELKRQQLQDIYKKEGSHASEKAQVIKLMNTTFCLQRSQINYSLISSTEDLKIHWPYLFTERGVFCHFESLTDINVLQSLELSMKECGHGVEKYLWAKMKNIDLHSVVSKDGELTLRVVQLLLTYFDEDTEGLILSTKACATAADVECTLELPDSPRLVLLMSEDKATVNQWMISNDEQVICEGSQPSVMSGLAALFATYYVFNLQYQEEAAKTLEFVQRRFIGINPERGSKANFKKVVSKKTGKLVQKKADPLNAHVATLIKNLTDFEWGFM